MSRPVFHEALGRFFRDMRIGRKLGLRQAAQVASNKGLTAITKQVLFALEKGKTKNPEPDVLRELAELYELRYEALAAEFIRYRYGLTVTARDLARHGSNRTSTLPPLKGVSDVPASDRQQEREHHAAFVSKVQNAASQLTKLAAVLGAETRAAQRALARRSRGNRKVG